MLGNNVAHQFFKISAMDLFRFLKETVLNEIPEFGEVVTISKVKIKKLSNDVLFQNCISRPLTICSDITKNCDDLGF